MVRKTIVCLVMVFVLLIASGCSASSPVASSTTAALSSISSPSPTLVIPTPHTDAPTAICPQPSDKTVTISSTGIGSIIERFEPQIEDYLNTRGSADGLEAALSGLTLDDGGTIWNAKSKVMTIDVNGDSSPDIVMDLIFFVEGQYADGAIFVFSCHEGHYEGGALTSIHGQVMSSDDPDPGIRTIQDMNLDGVPEIVFSYIEILGTHANFTRVFKIITWDGSKFVSLIQSEGYDPDTVRVDNGDGEIEDTNGDGTLELILTHGVGRGPEASPLDQPHKEVWSWDGHAFTFASKVEMSLSASGPWLTYITGEGIVAVNPDGTGRTLLAPPPLASVVAITFDMPNGIAPNTGWLATRVERVEPPGWDLNLLHMPDGQVKTITPLLSPELEGELEEGNLDIDIENAIFWEGDALRWSPDGRYLAFIAALDGPSSDLYVYDTADGTVMRLTSGLNQAATPIWSADGRWIVHQEVETFGSGAGWSVNTIWAAAADGSAIVRLYDVPDYNGPEMFLGVTTSNDLLVYRWSQSTPDLHVVSIDDGRVTVLHEGFPSVDAVALDPLSGAIAFTAGNLYLRSSGSDAVSVIDLRPWSDVIWAPGFNQFFAQGEARVLALTPAGESRVISEEQAIPVPSPDGSWLALSGKTLRLYSASWELVQELAIGTSTVIWRLDSEGLFFVEDDSLYYLPVPDGQPMLVETEVEVSRGFPFRDINGIGWVINGDQ